MGSQWLDPFFLVFLEDDARFGVHRARQASPEAPIFFAAVVVSG